MIFVSESFRMPRETEKGDAFGTVPARWCSAIQMRKSLITIFWFLPLAVFHQSSDVSDFRFVIHTRKGNSSAKKSFFKLAQTKLSKRKCGN